MMNTDSSNGSWKYDREQMAADDLIWFLIHAQHQVLQRSQ
jgi:hypothetical protein